MSIFNKRQNEQGSALLLVLFLIILLGIVVVEVSFSSHTSFSLAQTQIDKLRMDTASETGFAYALNLIRSPEKEVVINQEGEENDSNQNVGATNISPFSQAKIDANKTDESSDETVATAAWTATLPAIEINNVQLLMNISMEESKINLNRIVDDMDKVDMRMRTAILTIFEKFNGTEEDLSRIIDYVDKNNNGSYESGAKNGPAETLHELLNIEDIELKFSMEDTELKNEDQFNTDNTNNEEKNDLNEGSDSSETLADYFTVKSTGRVNINFCKEEVLTSLLNQKDEGSLAKAIIEQRQAKPFAKLSELSIDNKFKQGFRKLANYITVDTSTFKVNILTISPNSDATRCYVGYIFKGGNTAMYIYRSERFTYDDIELMYLSKSMNIMTEEGQPPPSNPEEKLE